MEASYVQVDGDFGQSFLVTWTTVQLLLWTVLLDRNNDIETQGGLADADTAIGIGNAADIIYMSPSMSGLKVGFSKDLDDDGRQT